MSRDIKPIAFVVLHLVLTLLLTTGMALAASNGTLVGGSVALALGVAAFVTSAHATAAAAEMFEPPHELLR